MTQQIKLTRAVVFDFNDGSGQRKIWECKKHQPIGTMPIPVQKGFVFVGWYTKPESGKGARFMERDSVERNMVLYAHWKKENKKKYRMGVEYNHMRDTWDNDSRNQTSLALGSDTYDDYIEDLQENDPGKPDDEMHVELEEHNENLAEKLAERATKSDVTMKKKIVWQMAKQAEAKRVHTQAVRRALSTPSTEDDAKLKQLEKSNSLIYDDGVTPDNYDDVYHDIVFG